jgi:hypothetical protein
VPLKDGQQTALGIRGQYRGPTGADIFPMSNEAIKILVVGSNFLTVS